MIRVATYCFIAFLITGCNSKDTIKRLPVAEVGNAILYYDEIPDLTLAEISKSDSIAMVQNYINKWAKRKLLLMKAEENLSVELKNEVARQLDEAKANLLIYQYQRQMMLEKMDTIVTETELENYYAANEKAFTLTSNIVKALFIKVPADIPDLNHVRTLARSNNQNDLQQLESLCFQFAEKFDDFNEAWVPMDRLSIELREDIGNEENFLRRTTYYETADSTSVNLVSVRDYRLRSSLAPYDYVRNDIKRIILNTRRIELIQSIENGIYNDALKANSFKIY